MIFNKLKLNRYVKYFVFIGLTFFQLYGGTLLISYLYSPEKLAYYLKASGLKSLPTTYICMVLTDIMISSLAAININKNKKAA